MRRPFLQALREDARETLADPLPNVLAGVTVAFVALPLALAFGLIALGPTLGPAAGLWAAILAGIVATLLGGSPYNITGPTVVVAVFTGEVILAHGGFASGDAIVLGLTVVVVSGLFQILFGVFRLAKVIELIPYPVVTGYMNGTAILIFLSGMKDILATSGASLTNAQLGRALVDFGAGHASWGVYAAAILAATTFAITFAWPKLAHRFSDTGLGGFAKRIPGSLLALSILTVVALLAVPFADVRRIGTLPSSLPSFALDFGLFARHPEWTGEMLKAALSLAVLSSMETLLSAVIADGVVGRRSRQNRELVGQGIGNAVGGSFGAANAAGAAVRTMVSVRNGGRTRLAALSHSFVLLALLLVGAGLAASIPVAVLSGILLFTGFGMVEWRALAQVRRSPKSDTAVMLVVTGAVVWLGIVDAVVLGVVLAALLFIHRMAELTDFVGEPEWTGTERRGMEGLERSVLVYEIRGPLFFGPAARFSKTFERANLKDYKVIVFRMNAVTAVDQTGLRSMELIVERLHQHGQEVVLAHIPDTARVKFERYGLFERVGPENVVASFDEAVARARVLVGLPAAAPAPATGSSPS